MENLSFSLVVFERFHFQCFAVQQWRCFTIFFSAGSRTLHSPYRILTNARLLCKRALLFVIIRTRSNLVAMDSKDLEPITSFPKNSFLKKVNFYTHHVVLTTFRIAKYEWTTKVIPKKHLRFFPNIFRHLITQWQVTSFRIEKVHQVVKFKRSSYPKLITHYAPSKSHFHHQHSTKAHILGDKISTFMDLQFQDIDVREHRQLSVECNIVLHLPCHSPQAYPSKITNFFFRHLTFSYTVYWIPQTSRTSLTDMISTRLSDWLNWTRRVLHYELNHGSLN